MSNRPNSNKRITSQIFNYASDSYLERTSRHIYALVFLLPFVVLYELGTILINTDLLHQTQIRVVAFAWLQELAEHIGLGRRAVWIGAPLMVVIMLLALQLASRKRWSFHVKDILPMTAECVIYAFPLIVLSMLFNRPFIDNAWQVQRALQNQSVIEGAPSNDEVTVQNNIAEDRLNVSNRSVRMFWAPVVTGIGAGIYEEFVFRMVLILVLVIVFQDIIGFNHRNSVIIAVIISAICFSLHHHVYPLNGQIESGEPFRVAAFIFRMFAGVYFAALYALRGFGMAAGTHTFYNIIATSVNVLFAGQVE
ncbi:MAG: CPBP family glutamic-type intramembrane protease [Planctomycetota bacterium]